MYFNINYLACLEMQNQKKRNYYIFWSTEVVVFKGVFRSLSEPGQAVLSTVSPWPRGAGWSQYAGFVEGCL
jgi:hypothetical protein